MKKLLNLSAAIIAALVSLSSCQKVNEIEEAPKVTHTVKFTTEAPTKTSYVVDGTTVNYKWEDEDIDRLHVYEDGIEGTIDVEKSEIEADYLKLTVNFEGTGEGVHKYTANLNECIVKSEQVADGKYDSTCDVLVAKPVSSDEIVEDYYTFRFRRPVAITELKLKGLKAEEKVSKVTIVSDADHSLVGTYTQSETDAADGTWDEKSNKIVITFGTEPGGETPKTKTVESDGSLIVPIVSMPVESASVKVLVETESGLKYRKVTSAALTLKENSVKSQGIGLTQVAEAEHAEDGWYLVTDANELFDGDEIRIACPSKGMIAGEFAVVSEETKEYLVANAATFTPGTYAQITGVDSEKKPNTFTLVENYGSFALVNENGKLGTTNAKKMSYDDGTGSYSGVTDWTIAIADNLATISAGDYGRILCNVTDTRFLNYTSNTSISMLLPQIYKRYGDASDPIIKKARTASFSPEKATVTIDAQGNVFPELSFEPEEATGGEQTWTSSNTEVATVNATTGEVTLVSDGTTTIKVEIAETDTYQPCSAEYVLTVKPAPVQGLDIIDNDFIGTLGSYTSWKDKASSSSGKTYAGNSTTKQNSNNIQMRSTKPSGIVVTASDGGKVARKITVKWDTSTDRTIDVYGKDSAYSSEDGASDLYDNSTDGDKLGSIVYGTSTELEIEGDYEFIGLRSKSGALYVESITIQWEDPKPEYEACFKDAGGNTVTEVNATVGSVFTAPTLYKGATSGFADAYESSNPDVAEVSNTGVVTLHKKGDAIITATLNGDETHRKTEVPYTIHVANVLSSIEITTEPTKKSYYVGDEADYSGIAVTANYNDNTSAEIAADKLNFSGFDSSEAVAEQAITVSYTENEVTKTDSYNVEIKAATTLYDIDVTGAADANGNSVTVEGSKEKAEEGDEITLNVNLATGYKLTSLKVNEVEHSADVAEGKYTFNMPAAAVTVTASFDNHYNVVLGSATNGSFTVNSESSSPVSVEYGTTVNLAATPATGYVFKKWTVEGAIVASATAATTSFTMPANDVTVNAEFDQPKDATYFYESFKNCEGTGGNDGNWSGSIASSTLTADNEGWTFASGSGAHACARFGTGSNKGSALTPSINISTSTAKLMFKAGAWNGSSEGTTLNISATNATLDRSSVTLKKGEWSTYTVDVTNITGPVKIKFEAKNASNNRFFLDEVYVYYGAAPVEPEPTEYTLTLTQVTGGTITAEVGGQPVSDGAKIEEGKTVTIKAAASSGYSFTSWALPTSGLSSPTSASATFTMSADTEVKASFTSTGGETTPFVWEGSSINGKDSLTGMDGVEANGLGSDYAASNAPYRVKLDGTGDYIIIKVGFEISTVQLKVKMIGGSTASSIKIQEFADKTSFTDNSTMSISGDQDSVIDFTTSSAFKSTSRYVKLTFTKGSNVGLGYIKITPKN